MKNSDILLKFGSCWSDFPLFLMGLRKKLRDITYFNKKQVHEPNLLSVS